MKSFSQIEQAAPGSATKPPVGLFKRYCDGIKALASTTQSNVKVANNKTLLKAVSAEMPRQ
ncbi:hypothetical protein ACS5PN_17295 [Roseateles sp. NT4]|uniref:hypothetical protein n=1 Tax=Roseateles sp. NT4 TaxID=3453715 RepID=UPI003EEDADC0